MIKLQQLRDFLLAARVDRFHCDLEESVEPELYSHYLARVSTTALVANENNTEVLAYAVVTGDQEVVSNSELTGIVGAQRAHNSDQRSCDSISSHHIEPQSKVNY